jgi:FeS assembly SUF system protein
VRRDAIAGPKSRTEQTMTDPTPTDGLPGTEPPTGSATDALRERVLDALRSCFDPEIPVNIYELGLVYDVDVTDDGVVSIRMTLTSPMCPVAGSLPPEVEEKVRAVEGVSSASVEVVWDPPWNPGMMSEAARLELNMF